MKHILKCAAILAVLALGFSLASCKNDTDDDGSGNNSGNSGNGSGAQTYTVSIASGIEHGTVTADKTSAEKGATVTLTLSASDGYEFGTLSVTDASNAEITTTAVTEGSKYTFTMPKSNVTVSATFKAKSSGGGTTGTTITTYQFHSTVTYLPEGTNGTAGTGATYCIFGDWPQTVKAESITVDETKSVTMGGMTYYLGSDNNYYAKCTENAYGNNYTYSDGTAVAQSNSNSEKYFKVEPIKWRVLNPNASGNKILVAESILTANPYYGSHDVRELNEATINSTNYKYSNIRAYLNGSKNQFVTDGGTATEYDVDWTGKGFLQTAFTSSAQSLIATTTVDNSAASTNPASDASMYNGGVNDYICENTVDKIFLLSEEEATTSDYGFNSNPNTADTSRMRAATDFAKANYASSWVWLRSPAHYKEKVFYLNGDGTSYHTLEVIRGEGSVVPALCLSSLE